MRAKCSILGLQIYVSFQVSKSQFKKYPTNIREKCNSMYMSVASKPGGPGGHWPPPLFCHAVSNENNMKNIEITNGLIFKKHVAFLTSRLPMVLCP